MSRHVPIVSVLLIALTLLAPAGATAEEARIIQLKHRSAEEIIPVIRPLLGPDDALSGTDYRLIVRTSNQNLKQVERVLVQLDVAQRQLRITVEQATAGDRQDTSQSVSGEARVGDNARIALPARPSDDRGLVVQKDDLRYAANRRTTTTGSANTQTVMTLDGQRAYIRIGHSVPYVQKILTLSRHQITIAQDIALQDVTTGFEVLPRVHGDQVRIEITPRLSTLQNPATGLVNFDADPPWSAPCGRAARVQIRSGRICQDFQYLTTTVEAKLGEWIDLGAILGSGNEIQRAILDSATAESAERRTVRLKIE